MKKISFIFPCVLHFIILSHISHPAFNIYSVDDPLALFDKIYDKPWTRFGPYMVGMSVGWILFKTDCSIKFSKVRTSKQSYFYQYCYYLERKPAILDAFVCITQTNFCSSHICWDLTYHTKVLII